MATFSRSQSSSTTTAESSISSLLSSKTISSLLVKSMQNTDNENMNEDGLVGGLKDTITQAINDSDLVNGKGGKDKDKNDKDLNNLLKDKQNTDKELADFLKNKKNDDKELSGLLKNNNKEKSSAGKALGIAAIGATVGAVLKSKSIGQATGTVVSGAGKVAGGLVSGVGNLGGSVIAGIGKLFGPIGGVIGKAVGTAVAAPFKLVGGVVTKAIGALGSLLSMPLKEMVTKTGLLVAVGSQLFVFLEALMAKFLAEKDIRVIDFMSNIQASIESIPSRIKLSFEKTLSQVRVLGHPIFGGGLSKDEKKELKALEKKDTALASAQDKLMDSAASWLGKSEASQYNISDPEQREALKQAMLEKTRSQAAEGIMPAVSEYDIEKYFSNYEKRAAKSKLSPEEVERLGELRALKENGKRDWTAEENAIDNEQDRRSDEIFVKKVSNLADKKGGITSYQQNLVEDIRGKGTMGKIKDYYSETRGTELDTRSATAAEKFLDNQYKAWTNAWKDMLSHTLQNTIGVNVNVNQETSRSNPV